MWKKLKSVFEKISFEVCANRCCFLLSIFLFCSVAFLEVVNPHLTLFSAVVLLLFYFLPGIESFEIFGVLKAKLNDKIAEADDLISNLKKANFAVAEFIMTTYPSQGRFGRGLSRRKEYELYKNIENSLINTQSPSEKIEEIKKEIYRYAIFDLSSDIYEYIKEAVSKKVSDKNNQKETLQPEDYENCTRLVKETWSINHWFDEFKSLRQQNDLMSLDKQIKKHIENCTHFSTEEKENIINYLKEHLDDLTFYIEKKSFRRPDVWFEGD